MREYTTPKREQVVVEFMIDGVKFAWTKPKNASMAMPIIDAEPGQDREIANLKALFDWIGNGLPDEQEELLEKRLRDPEDDFDVEDLNAIVEILLEEASAVPPTSPPASGGQPATTG